MSKTNLYTVERIVGKRIKDTNIVEYKVKWEGYPSTQNTWEPIKNLSTVTSLIRQFENRNKDKLPLGINKHLVGRNDEDSKSKIRNSNKIKLEVMKPQKKHAIRTPQPAQKPRLSKLRKDASQSSEKKSDRSNPKNSIHPQETSDPESDILEMNISDIAEKILAVAISKQKGYKIVEVIKKLYPKEQVIYVVEDQQGKRSEHSRSYMLESHPQQMLDFYEMKIHQKLQCGQVQ